MAEQFNKFFSDKDLNAMKNAANRGETLRDSSGNAVTEEAAPAAGKPAKPARATAAPKPARAPRSSSFDKTVVNKAKVQNIVGTISGAVQKFAGEDNEEPTREGESLHFYGDSAEEQARKARDEAERAADPLDAPARTVTVTPEMIDDQRNKRESEEAQASNTRRPVEELIPSRIGVDSASFPTQEEDPKEYEGLPSGLANLKQLGNALLQRITAHEDQAQREIPGGYSNSSNFDKPYDQAAQAASGLIHHMHMMEHLVRYPGTSAAQRGEYRNMTPGRTPETSAKPAILKLAETHGLSGNDVVRDGDDFEPTTAEGHALMVAKHIGTLSKWLEKQSREEQSTEFPTLFQTHPVPGRIDEGSGVEVSVPNLPLKFANALPPKLTPAGTKTTSWGAAAMNYAAQVSEDPMKAKAKAVESELFGPSYKEGDTTPRQARTSTGLPWTGTGLTGADVLNRQQQRLRASAEPVAPKPERTYPDWFMHNRKVELATAHLLSTNPRPASAERHYGESEDDPSYLARVNDAAVASRTWDAKHGDTLEEINSNPDKYLSENGVTEDWYRQNAEGKRNAYDEARRIASENQVQRFSTAQHFDYNPEAQLTREVEPAGIRIGSVNGLTTRLGTTRESELYLLNQKKWAMTDAAHREATKEINSRYDKLDKEAAARVAARQAAEPVVTPSAPAAAAPAKLTRKQQKEADALQDLRHQAALHYESTNPAPQVPEDQFHPEREAQQGKLRSWIKARNKAIADPKAYMDSVSAQATAATRLDAAPTARPSLAAKRRQAFADAVQARQK